MRATFQIISRDDRLAIPVLFVIAWLMRVAVVFLHPQPDHFISTDTLHYWEGARSIVANGLPADNTFPVGLSYFMTPFVALGLSLWSYGHFIQPALGAALVALSYLLASRLGGRLAGWLAGTICLLHPALINSSSQILTEDLSAVLILSGIVLLLKKEHLPVGIVFGSANIVRSPSLGMFCLLLIVLVRTGYDWKHSFRPLLGGWAAVIILTSIHLSMAYGRFVFLTPQVWELGVTRPLAQGGVFYMLSAEAREHYGSYLGFAIHHPFEFLADRLAAFHAFINTWPGEHRTTLTKAVMTLSEARSCSARSGFS